MITELMITTEKPSRLKEWEQVLMKEMLDKNYSNLSIDSSNTSKIPLFTLKRAKFKLLGILLNGYKPPMKN